MRFTIGQSVLNDVLNLVGKVVPAKAVHPVLTCFRVEAEATQGTVSVTGFDLSMGINAVFPANVDEGGTVAVPAKLLMDIVSRLPQGELTFQEDELLTVLTSSSGSYEVRGMSAEEYPELPDISGDATQRITFEPESLVNGIKNTLFAISSDEAKQVLNGLHFQLRGKTLEFASTDGHRLATTVIASEDLADDSEFDATIPLRVMRELERIFQKRAEPIVVDFSEEQLVVRVNDGDRHTTVTARTLQGKYPDYKQLLPPVFERKITVDRKNLLASLERISVFATNKEMACIFAISEGDQQIALSTEAQDIGSGREDIDAQVIGTDITFGFNIRYLLDILRTAQSNDVELHTNAALAPVVFRPVGDPNTVFLMMPKQLRGGSN